MKTLKPGQEGASDLPGVSRTVKRDGMSSGGLGEKTQRSGWTRGPRLLNPFCIPCPLLEVGE